MAENPIRESFKAVDLLVVPISGDNPSGISLRYDRIYDDIRDARREDDDTVSYGIWQYELKRSDWGRVESLCCQALSNQTKDLQIAGWLGEAWIILDGILGLQRGLELITQLTAAFWDSMYPTVQNKDFEYRSQFYDWLDKSLSARLVKLIFVPNELGEGITLADWLAAQRFDSVIKRAPNADRLIKKAEERGQVNFKNCYTLLSRVSTEAGDHYIESLETTRSTLHNLKEVLDQKFPHNTLAFDELEGHLDEMTRIYKSEMATRQRTVSDPTDDSLNLSVPHPPEVTDTVLGEGPLLEGTADSSLSIVVPTSTTASNTLQSREQAYKQLSDIANLLDRLEPHSPAPQILRRVISWESKSLMEIFNEMGSSPEDLVALMRFLGMGTPKTGETVSPTR
ncbi:MAG: type VI secretion system protein TssA [Candidatus Paracaedibacteraceae bacterium]|nr:type VI secretion system protein TssA [Candidatus Paracaedibacteraceae bacterium]